ncbi:hypothetical protein [Lysobacter enzymogenes]|uniref:hypothetical protein n=1 Tax=Lysobacter enzymogenes TaxID=69 RepID=UPI0011176520|nr:hypothetical protein [Lysobacter enzymogenes]UZW61883.1 type IV secretion system protein [Lysobacter enzymogenes]
MNILSRRRILALSLTAVVLAVSGMQQAWAIDIVFDPKNTAESMKQLEEMKRSYDKLNDQYKELQKQYNQQLINGQSYFGRDGVKVKLDRRPLGFGVAERCTDIKNPGSKQKELCAALVQTQNRQFNAMVDLQELTEAREGELKDIYRERSEIKPDEAGRLQANSNRLLSFQARTQVDLQNAQNLLEAYGGQVRVLEQEHSKAAQAVIDGEHTGSKLDLKRLGQGGVRAAALKTAFDIAKRRER